MTDERRGDHDPVAPAAAIQFLYAIFAAQLAGGVGLFLAVAVRTLFYPHEVIVSEGAIGLAVRSIRDGVALYDPVRWSAEPFVIVHYTPLYYLVTAAASKLASGGALGGLFVPGRLVSILSTIGTALVAGHAVRRVTGRVAPGLAASALWLSFYQVVFWGTTQRVDALGIFFESLGVWLFLEARRTGRIGYRAIPWFVLAWSTKQVMIVGLLAAVVALFLQEGLARAARFAAWGFGTILVIAAALMYWSGGGFWTATVLGTVSSKADTPWVIFSNAELFFGSPWNMLLLAAATWAAWVGSAPVVARWRSRGREVGPGGAGGSRGGSREGSGAGGTEAGTGAEVGGTGLSASLALFLGLYLWIGLLLAIATDANLPRFFPPMVAMALLVAMLLDRARCAPRLATGLLLALVLVFGAHALYEMRSLVRERIVNLHEDNERLLFARALERHTRPGDLVLVQDVGMALSAARIPVVADPYVFSILAGNRAWRPDVLEKGIRARRYGAVVLNRPLESLDPAEWTTLWISPAKAALLDHYRLAETVTIDQEWRFLEPTRYVYVPSN